MPVRKPSLISRSFSRITTNKRTTKRTISFSVSTSVQWKNIKTLKKIQLALSKNFSSTVIQKNNSVLRRHRLPNCSVRTIARISANNNGCSNCKLIRSSSSGNLIKWNCWNPVDSECKTLAPPVISNSPFWNRPFRCPWAVIVRSVKSVLWNTDEELRSKEATGTGSFSIKGSTKWAGLLSAGRRISSAENSGKIHTLGSSYLNWLGSALIGLWYSET